jgi:hypothetical protein
MHVRARVPSGRPFALTLPSLVLLSGCLPFFGSKGAPQRTPLAVERFAAAASELGLPPSPPPIDEATRMLADAVESLRNAPGAHERAQEINAQAQAMHAGGADHAEHARHSLELALGALQQMKKPAGSKKERERALNAVRNAVGVADGYRALARAMVLFSGGRDGLPAGATLRALVARLSVEDDDIARRTIAEIVRAIADELRALRLDAGNLDERAEKLTGAAPLEYAPALRDALDRAVTALRKYKAGTPAFATLAAEAHDAVQRITRDRPFELQRAATQDALRLISDTLTVASPTTTGGR